MATSTAVPPKTTVRLSLVLMTCWAVLGTLLDGFDDTSGSLDARMDMGDYPS